MQQNLFFKILGLLTSSSSTEEPSTSKGKGEGKSSQKRRKCGDANNEGAKNEAAKFKRSKEEISALDKARINFYEAHTESQKAYQEAQRQIALTQIEIRAYYRCLTEGNNNSRMLNYGPSHCF